MYYGEKLPASKKNFISSRRKHGFVINKHNLIIENRIIYQLETNWKVLEPNDVIQLKHSTHLLFYMGNPIWVLNRSSISVPQ